MTVRILFVEDSQDDVELQLRRLRESGLEPQWDRVQSETALRAALADETWQVALVDYNIPGFSGVEALRLIAELAPDLPAITVSGSIDEDTAVATMSAGAVDYVLKDNLMRLPPAVRRAVDGADLRRAHRQAAESAHLALFALDRASLSIGTVAEDGTVMYVNDRACRDFCKERAELLGVKIWDIDERMAPEVWSGLWQQAVSEGTVVFRMAREQHDGRRIVLDTTVDYLEGAELLITYGRDVTARVLAEEALRAEQANLAAIFEASPVAMMVCDADANVVRVNRATLRLTGRDMESLLDHQPDSEVQCGDVLGCMHHAEATHGCGTSPECPLCPLRNAVSAVLADDLSLRGVELSLDVVNDGEQDVLWLRIGAEPMLMNGAPHVTVAIDDITDRRRAEFALKESEKRFRSLADQVPGFVSIKDSDLRYLFLSSLARTRVDGGEESWLGKRPQDLWEPKDASVSNSTLKSRPPATA